MKSSAAPQQYHRSSDLSRTSHIEVYPDSEHLIAWDDRFSSGERFQREEQIRREVERALAVQKLSRTRKAGARESEAHASVECRLYDQDSLIRRARARQDSAYMPRVIASGNPSQYYGTPHSVSPCHVALNPRDSLPSSPKKSASLSRFNPFKTLRKESSTSSVDEDPSSCPIDENDGQKNESWGKKLQHVATIAILGYNPDAKGEPYL